MGSLASELLPIAEGVSDAPRVYVDANMPAGLVGFMRHALGWDVLFVLEDPALRRRPDRDHFARALDLGRTLITLDHDFSDDRAFPPPFSPGVIVCSAPNEAGLTRIMRHIDRTILRAAGAAVMPLRGQKMVLTIDAVPVS